MKKAIFVLSTILFFQTVSYAADSQKNFIAKAQIKNKYVKNLCKNKKSSFTINYPQIEKLSNRIIENKINTYLKKEFNDPKNGQCEDYTKDDIYKSDTNYAVFLNDKGILSLTYSNEGYLEKSAHPNNLTKGINIFLNKGTPIEFKSLFTKNSKYVERINEFIKKSLEKQKIDFPLDYQKSDYDFFLTDKELVIINIFDFHAMQGVDAQISYASIKDILDKKGPLELLLK